MEIYENPRKSTKVNESPTPQPTTVEYAGEKQRMHWIYEPRPESLTPGSRRKGRSDIRRRLDLMQAPDFGHKNHRSALRGIQWLKPNLKADLDSLI